MSFLSNLAKGALSKSDSDDKDNKSGTSDLLADAKLVAEAAQAQFHNEPEKYDKGKVAGAAADLLDAASGYAKLDETKGVGKYVDQAEDYLRGYNSGQAPPPAAAAAAAEEQKAPASDAPPPAKDSGEEKPPADAEKPSGGGYGDLMKMAGDFLQK
ncbi:nodulin-related protein 2 [Andrographis paniculata]|uniref:nodulin-related protein 2 n=1 Tax=Andrographis paniculata TaxID=175694 RepID=UPI0021E99B85|nr:nodulin-related protein 2 [Andrographis paniculata]